MFFCFSAGVSQVTDSLYFYCYNSTGSHSQDEQHPTLQHQPCSHKTNQQQDCSHCSAQQVRHDDRNMLPDWPHRAAVSEWHMCTCRRTLLQGTLAAALQLSLASASQAAPNAISSNEELSPYVQGEFVQANWMVSS
jgi:hypothetical protein